MVGTTFQDGTVLYAANINAAFALCAAVGSGGSATLTFASTTANGTTQATARPLTANVNIITAANANSGVIITAPSGAAQYILHRGGGPLANTLNIFPPSGANVEQQFVNLPVQIANNYTIGIYSSSATQIYIISGGPSTIGL